MTRRDFLVQLFATIVGVMFGAEAARRILTAPEWQKAQVEKYMMGVDWGREDSSVVVITQHFADGTYRIVSPSRYLIS